jgi:hypothetical protein
MTAAVAHDRSEAATAAAHWVVIERQSSDAISRGGILWGIKAGRCAGSGRCKRAFQRVQLSLELPPHVNWPRQAMEELLPAATTKQDCIPDLQWVQLLCMEVCPLEAILDQLQATAICADHPALKRRGRLWLDGSRSRTALP